MTAWPTVPDTIDNLRAGAYDPVPGYRALMVRIARARLERLRARRVWLDAVIEKYEAFLEPQ